MCTLALIRNFAWSTISSAVVYEAGTCIENNKEEQYTNLDSQWRRVVRLAPKP